jgi:hypothetical protein
MPIEVLELCEEILERLKGPRDERNIEQVHVRRMAGIGRAVVLSLGYQFGNPNRPPVEDEYAKVRAENDWTAQQVANHRGRLVGFCGVCGLGLWGGGRHGFGEGGAAPRGLSSAGTTIPT